MGVARSLERYDRDMGKSTVYYIGAVTPENVVKVYEALGVELPGKVGVKLHSGEPGNQNFLGPSMWKPMIERVGGTIIESNTAYDGGRGVSDKHWATMKEHGWTAAAPVDILDEEGELSLPVRGGVRIQQNFVGSHLANYDSILMASHFKGHPMGGFGGACKNMSIGIASSHGKKYIHGAGDVDVSFEADHDAFLESMADADRSIMDFFPGRIAFVNVMANMSVDCDCCSVAEDPAIADIGVLASLDPVALDQACVDLVYASDDPGRDHLVERIESRNGVHTLEAAAGLGVGSREYELVRLD